MTRLRTISSHGQMVRQLNEGDGWKLLRLVKPGEDELSADAVALRALCDAEQRHEQMRADPVKWATWGFNPRAWEMADERMLSITCRRCKGDVSVCVDDGDVIYPRRLEVVR